MTDARQLNDARALHRPYPRGKSTDPRSNPADSVPVLFSLPTIQSTFAPEEADGDAALGTATRAAAPTHEPLVRSQRTEIAAAQDHQSEAHAASILTSSATLSPTVVGIHPHLESSANPAVATAKNTQWSNYAFNATIGGLVLALCFLVLRNSSQNRASNAPSNTSNAASLTHPSLDSALSQPSSLPTSVTWPAAPASNPTAPANNLASPAISPDAFRDTFTSQPSNPSIPATMATSQNPSLHGQPSHSQTPNPAPNHTPAPQRAPGPPMSVPNLLPSGGSTSPSFPNTRPSMPAQGEAWDSSSLTPNASLRPSDSSSIAESPVGPDSRLLSPVDDTNFDELAPEALPYGVLIPAEGVSLASATLAVTETQPTNTASQPSPISQPTPIREPASDAPQLNTRDIIQLRQGQRRPREASATPVVNAAFTTSRTPPTNATNNIPWNARPNANATPASQPAMTMTGQPYPPVRRSYEPISLQSDPSQQPTPSNPASPSAVAPATSAQAAATTAPPATRYQPVGSPPTDPASLPTAPNSNASPARPVQPYTPVSPVLPDPF
jgi:hypothetical protein